MEAPGRGHFEPQVGGGGGGGGRVDRIHEEYH